MANQGMDLARQEVDQARDRFQAGVANNIEVMSAQNELARANDNQIAALYRYQPGAGRPGARRRADGGALRQVGPSIRGSSLSR